MKTALTSILLGLFWIAWMPCALLKDAVSLIYVPFDTQRLINTYIQTIRNAQQLGNIWEPIPAPQTQPQQPGIRKIGFEGKPPTQSGQLSGPIC